MFCPNCGTNLPDGAGFCAECGTQLNAAQSSASQTAYQPGQALKKGEYLKTQASPKAKQLVKISWGLLVVCVLILALGLNACLNGPFYEIPVFKMALGDDYADAMGELDDIIDEAEDGIDALEDEFGDEFDEDELEEIVEMAEKMVDNMSINNVTKLAKLMKETEVVEVMNIFVSVLWVCFGLVMLVTVLGGLFKKTGLVITALILAVPVCIAFSGTLSVILALVAYIALAVVLSKINKEYRAYRKSLKLA